MMPHSHPNFQLVQSWSLSQSCSSQSYSAAFYDPKTHMVTEQTVLHMQVICRAPGEPCQQVRVAPVEVWVLAGLACEAVVLPVLAVEHAVVKPAGAVAQ
jgi:hypothetical protein